MNLTRSQEDTEQPKKVVLKLWSGLIVGGSRRSLLIAAFLIGVAVTLAHRPWKQIEIGDEAIWDYISQSILRGQVPYRDVIEIKTPGSAYLSASAILIGRWFGLPDVLAVRLLYVLMVGALSAITVAVAEYFFQNRLATLIAFLVPLASWRFPEWMAAGTEPKLPMILFGTLSLLLLARDKPIWAGVCSMLSFLCWQPGLLFTGTLVLVSSRCLTRWRDLRALKVLLGALVPLGILAAYFLAVGAFRELWGWTIAYNYSVYAPQTTRPPGEAAIHLWRIVLRVFGLEIIIVLLSAIGIVMFGIAYLRGGLKELRVALLIPPTIYLGFCLVSFQSGPDLIPLFPFIGLFAAYAIVRISNVRLGRASLSPFANVALIVIACLVVFRAISYRLESGLTLQDQQKEFAVIANELGPRDVIYVHGSVEILVLLNRPNLNPYIFLDRRKDDWISQGKPGGFSEVIDATEARAPKIVALSRLSKVDHRNELEQWVTEHYDHLDLPGYHDLYIRKSDQKSI